MSSFLHSQTITLILPHFKFHFFWNCFAIYCKIIKDFQYTCIPKTSCEYYVVNNVFVCLYSNKKMPEKQKKFRFSSKIISPVFFNKFLNWKHLEMWEIPGASKIIFYWAVFLFRYMSKSEEKFHTEKFRRKMDKKVVMKCFTPEK